MLKLVNKQHDEASLRRGSEDCAGILAQPFDCRVRAVYEGKIGEIMFERVDYIVAKIDGDYAHLQRIDAPEIEPKLVARALLPADIYEGCTLIYEMLSYRMGE